MLPMRIRLLTPRRGVNNRIRIGNMQTKSICVAHGSAQETGHISTPPLNALQHVHVEPINLVICEVPHNDYLSCGPFPAYMLSAVIGTRHSYPAVPLARQLVDQRSVHPGPLVLGTTPLNNQRL